MIFIDLEEDDLGSYKSEMAVINRGYQPPITFIGGQPAFTGQVDHFKTYQILKKI
ncbi:hypothetical protein NSA47_06210 [Irregularibacter muris]|uniref:Glutaredoxin domain-containing protein n=2 Tax=Irregularibacter muris TaxID=1796619 RepID=A0AAE3HDJ4_9FIRM|nr:hypothetical protein [Irregularibacter muris]